jgi:hypothetical protein
LKVDDIEPDADRDAFTTQWHSWPGQTWKVQCRSDISAPRWLGALDR